MGGSSFFSPQQMVWPEESHAPPGQVLGHNRTHATCQLHRVTEYPLVAHALLCALNFIQRLQRLGQGASWLGSWASSVPEAKAWGGGTFLTRWPLLCAQGPLPSLTHSFLGPCLAESHFSEGGGHPPAEAEESFVPNMESSAASLTLPAWKQQGQGWPRQHGNTRPSAHAHPSCRVSPLPSPQGRGHSSLSLNYNLCNEPLRLHLGLSLSVINNTIIKIIVCAFVFPLDKGCWCQMSFPFQKPCPHLHSDSL